MPRSPIDATKTALRGAVAGAVGTLAMDLVWYARYRRGGGGDGFVGWEFSASTEGFDDAGAPAQVGKKVAGALGIDLPDDAAGITTNVVHWATGAQWGALYALATRTGRGAGPLGGLLLGVGAVSAAYGLLGAAGIYQPPWRYDAETLGKDLSAHLVFGSATAAAHRLLGGSSAT